MEHKHDHCKEVFALLSDYLDSELAPQSCEEIEKHLAGCAPCVEFFESLKRTVKLCHECSPCEEPPPPLTEAEREHLRAAYQKAAAARRRG